MDRKNYPVSVMPYSIDRASNVKKTVVDESADWDAKWLRPNVTRMPVAKPVEILQKRAAAPETIGRIAEATDVSSVSALGLS